MVRFVIFVIPCKAICPRTFVSRPGFAPIRVHSRSSLRLGGFARDLTYQCATWSKHALNLGKKLLWQKRSKKRHWVEALSPAMNISGIWSTHALLPITRSPGSRCVSALLRSLKNGPTGKNILIFLALKMRMRVRIAGI